MYNYIYMYIIVGNKKLSVSWAADPRIPSPGMIRLKLRGHWFLLCSFVSGWWFGTCFFPPYIGNNNHIIPTDELIFFRGVGQPPTSMTWWMQMGLGLIVDDLMNPNSYVWLTCWWFYENRLICNDGLGLRIWPLTFASMPCAHTSLTPFLNPGDAGSAGDVLCDINTWIFVTGMSIPVMSHLPGDPACLRATWLLGSGMGCLVGVVTWPLRKWRDFDMVKLGCQQGSGAASCLLTIQHWKDLDLDSHAYSSLLLQARQSGVLISTNPRSLMVTP